MTDTMKRLIVFVTCQRTGSSISAEIFYRHGMSLGPFPFLAAAPENPLGLCEAMPVFRIDHALHRLVYGFDEDAIPYDRAGRIMADRPLQCPTIQDVPSDLIEQGKTFITQLTDSAPVSGFKHPASILFRFYWEHVFSSISDLEIAPVFLIRSPSGVAASYARRAKRPEVESAMFDLIGIYLDRMLELHRSFQGIKPIVRFSEEYYRDDLKNAIEACGMAWDAEMFRQYYKPSATVAIDEPVDHPVEDLYRRFLALCR